MTLEELRYLVPPLWQDAYDLLYIEGHSVAYTAKKLDRSEGWVRWVFGKMLDLATKHGCEDAFRVARRTAPCSD
jgi:hypothetical protein